MLHIAGGVRRRPGGSKEDWGWILSTSGTPRLGLIREEGCGEELEAAHEELPPLRAVAPDSAPVLSPSRRRAAEIWAEEREGRFFAFPLGW